MLNIDNDDDDEADNSFKNLRKAVKENWNTMKEYYRAVRYHPVSSLALWTIC